jgi:hypothetical protein
VLIWSPHNHTEEILSAFWENRFHNRLFICYAAITFTNTLATKVFQDRKMSWQENRDNAAVSYLRIVLLLKLQQLGK